MVLFVGGYIYRIELNPYRATNKTHSIDYLSDFPILDYVELP